MCTCVRVSACMCSHVWLKANICLPFALRFILTLDFSSIHCLASWHSPFPRAPLCALILRCPPLPPPFVKSILSMFLFMNNFVVGCIHTPYGQCLRYNHTLCTRYVYAGTSLGFSFIFWICTHFSLWMSLLGSCTCVNVVDFRSAPVYSNARGLRSMTSNFQTLPLCLSTPRLLKLVKKKKKRKKKRLRAAQPSK